ncbi:MAG: carboxymuconolactone decarboxylase family protein [Chloroflexi bacterium]|nr:carboxymuconolactone decarboxylase family protein [Chloroflexota bacterium]
MDEAQAYLDHMVRERGYVLDFHKTLAAEDLDFLRAYNQLIEAAYVDKDVLDARTKELLYSAVLTALGGFPSHIKAHMELAARAGATKQEVLAMLQLLLPAAGVPRFMLGFQVWQEVFQPRKLEPSPAP